MLLTVFEVFIAVHGLALIRVSFLFLLLCPPPCPGGCLCTTELCMGVFCGTWCYDSFYWGPCCNMASNILLSLVVSLSFIWFSAFVALYMWKLSKVFSILHSPFSRDVDDLHYVFNHRKRENAKHLRKLPHIQRDKGREPNKQQADDQG